MTSRQTPRWRVLYEAMRHLTGDQALTYAQMGQLLDLDPADRSGRSLIAEAARRAAQELRDRDRRIARVVRGHGYRLADTAQVLVLAHQHQTRAVAEVEAGAGAIDTIDLSTLDATTARLVQATAMGFARQAAVMRSMDIRQQRLEATMAALETTTTQTAHQIQETTTRIDQTQTDLRALQERITDLESVTPRPARHPGHLTSPFST